MRWRWLWLDFIPAGMDLGVEERASVRERARAGVTFAGREGMGAFVIAVVLVVPWLLAMLWLAERAATLGLPGIAALPLGLAGGWIILVLALGPILAGATYRELRRRGYDVCVHCGHRRRGPADADDECPDCANPRGQAVR